MGVTFIAPQGTYTAPAKLVTKEITENGTYDATDDSANGYSSVTVNVEGGGGSSDFSTATVTVTKSAGKNLCMPYIIDNEQSSIIPFVASAGEYTAVLYKGLCLAMAIDMDDTSSEPTVAVTGNATADGSEITITGDCAITIS